MLRVVVAILYLGWASACAHSIAEPPVRLPKNSNRVFVVVYGWHSGIVIPRVEIRERVLPEIRDFGLADYLEFGWGDWDYYQAPDPGVGLALKAAFWSSGAVLYVGGFTGETKDFFRGNEIFELPLSDESLARLIEFVSNTFLRTTAGTPAQSMPGLYPHSRFYPATGKFHLFRTCNTWVAEALAFAGVPINPTFAFTAGNLSSQLKRAGGSLRTPQ
jgi:uncharacterized protein (TIGR02117 family)